MSFGDSNMPSYRKRNAPLPDLIPSSVMLLQSLNINDCKIITDEGIRSLASGLNYNPWILGIVINKITDAGISAFANEGGSSTA